VTLRAALRLTPTNAEDDQPEARELCIMLTNCFRKFSFLAGTGILAACLWILAGTAASAQSSGEGDLQANVASALTHDPMLKNQPVTAYTANGVVTLTGTVETEQQRQEAETVAANVKGVSGIQNNITVAGSESAQAQTAPPPPADAQPAPPPPPPDTQQPAAAPDSQQIPPPPPPDEPAQPAQPAPQRAPYAPYPQRGYGQPYPQQTSGPVTIPAGTLLQIRISEPLDIAKLQDGAAFQATAASDVFEGNVLAIPRGAVLQGTVVKVKKPGALGGSGELQLQVTAVNLSGQSYPAAFWVADPEPRSVRWSAVERDWQHRARPMDRGSICPPRLC
jgi:hypothetical protein